MFLNYIFLKYRLPLSLTFCHLSGKKIAVKKLNNFRSNSIFDTL